MQDINTKSHLDKVFFCGDIDYKMQVQENRPFFTEMLLLEKLGPAPTISKVARFLEEAPSTTWRRLRDGYLEEVEGEGITRITLKSLAALLNGSRPHEVTYKRGKLPGEQRPTRREKTTTGAKHG
jgi:hypothetical protein